MSEMSPSNEQVRAAIAEQAGAWFVENRDGPLDAAARAAFMAWLHTSPVQVQEYLAVAVLARDLPAATNPPHGSIESLLAAARADADNVVSIAPARQASARARTRWSATLPASTMDCIAVLFWSAALIPALKAVTWRPTSERKSVSCAVPD